MTAGGSDCPPHPARASVHCGGRVERGEEGWLEGGQRNQECVNKTKSEKKNI